MPNLFTKLQLLIENQGVNNMEHYGGQPKHGKDKSLYSE